MTYTIITPSVQKQLDALPNDIYERIAAKILQLALNPLPDGVVKIEGADDEYRIRIGDYRVRYEIVVLILEQWCVKWVLNTIVVVV